MKTENKLVIAGTIAIIAIILAGQLCMNMDVKNEYCVNYEGDVATYEINLGYVSNYSVVSFDDGGLGRNTNFVTCLGNRLAAVQWFSHGCGKKQSR